MPCVSGDIGSNIMNRKSWLAQRVESGSRYLRGGPLRALPRCTGRYKVAVQADAVHRLIRANNAFAFFINQLPAGQQLRHVKKGKIAA